MVREESTRLRNKKRKTKKVQFKAREGHRPRDIATCGRAIVPETLLFPTSQAIGSASRCGKAKSVVGFTKMFVKQKAVAKGCLYLSIW